MDKKELNDLKEGLKAVGDSIVTSAVGYRLYEPTVKYQRKLKDALLYTVSTPCLLDEFPMESIRLIAFNRMKDLMESGNIYINSCEIYRKAENLVVFEFYKYL